MAQMARSWSSPMWRRGGRPSWGTWSRRQRARGLAAGRDRGIGAPRAWDELLLGGVGVGGGQGGGGGACWRSERAGEPAGGSLRFMP